MAGRTTVGLDIGTSGVRAAEISTGRGGITLQRFGQVALPPGAVRAGEVVDVDAVSAAIKHLWSQARIGTKKVALGVANQKVIVRQVDLPWLPADELRASLGFQAGDYIPMPLEQVILDYHPVEEYVGDGGARMVRVLLVAAARDMVGNGLLAAQKAGLTVSQVDLTPFAVLRSTGTVSTLGAGDTSEAIVDIGSQVTNIVVHQNGIPRFVRILLLGGDSVTEAVAERMGVPFDQADSVKQQLGVSVTPGIPTSDHPAARVSEAAVSQLLDEIRGSLDYYLAQPSALPIREVLLSGGGAQLTGLGARLGAAVRVPVRPGTPVSSLNIGKVGLTAEQLSVVESYAAAPVGLAMAVAS